MNIIIGDKNDFSYINGRHVAGYPVEYEKHDDGRFCLVVHENKVKNGNIEGCTEKMQIHSRVFLFFDNPPRLKDLMQLVGVEFKLGSTYFDGRPVCDEDLECGIDEFGDRTHVMMVVEKEQ